MRKLLLIGSLALASLLYAEDITKENTGEQLELDLDDKFADRFDAICVDNMLGNLDQLIAKDE